jgi:hypothetical protein
MPVYKQPQRPQRRDNAYDDELSSLPELNERSSGISNDAGSTVDSIDDVLAQNEADNQSYAASNGASGHADGGSHSDRIARNVDRSIGQHHQTDSQRAGEDESRALDKMNQGVAGGAGGGAADQLGRGYTNNANTWADTANALRNSGGPTGIAKEAMRFLGQKAGQNKNLLGGIGIGGGLTATIIGLFMTALPFSFNSIMNGIVDKEFKVVNTDMSEMQDTLMSHLIKKYILPGMKLHGCTSTLVDKDCAVAVPGDGPVQRMFRAQLKGHIDNIMAKQGFELRFDKANNKYFIRSNGVKGDIDITKFVGTDGNLFHEIDNKSARALWKQTYKRATFWDRLLLRIGWSKKTLKANYGNIRCTFTCEVLDGTTKHFTDPIDVRKRAFKIKLAQLALRRSKVMSLAVTCLIAGSTCDPNEPDIDPNTGEYRTSFEKDIRVKMDELRALDNGDVSLKRAKEIFDGVQKEGGFTQFIIKELVKGILDKAGASEATKQTTAQIAGYAVPGVDLVVGFSNIISTLSTLGPKIKALNSQIQIASAVALFAMNSTYDSETKSANVDSVITGSMSDQFGRNQQVLDDGHTMGGADAGTTPLYNTIINDGNGQTTAFNSLFGAKTYAATADDPTETKAYHCPITDKILDPSGKDHVVICPEQSLKYAGFIGNAFGSISNFLNLPGISVITSAANLISGTVNAISGAISDKIAKLVEKIPGYDSLLNTISSAATPVFGSIVKYIFPSWLSNNNSGGTNFIGTVLGGDATANSYLENVLRAGVITPKQKASIVNDATEMEEIQFKHKSLYARIFDKEDTHSFVTRMSLALPTDAKTNFGSMAAQLISDPFSKLMRTFSAAFAGKRAFAAVEADNMEDPFGLPQHGIPLEDAVFHTDPEVYYSSRCADSGHNAEWNSHVVIDPDTGLNVHQNSDPCGLIDEGVQVGGGVFDSSLAGQ